MNDKSIRQINREIIDALLARKLPAIPNKKIASELLRTPGWTQGLASLFPIRERLSCAQVLDLCAPILETLSPQTPEKGWGAFCYRYVSNLMFPRDNFTPEAEAFGAGAEFYLTVLQVLFDQNPAAVGGALPEDGFFYKR